MSFPANTFNGLKIVTIQQPLFREVFWHEYAKIPRVSGKKPIAEGDFYWIFARNYEGTEQLRKNKRKKETVYETALKIA